MARFRNQGDYYIGALHTCERQCGSPECESWQTLKLVIVGRRDNEVAEWEFPLCWQHMEEFVKKYVFGGETNTILHPDGTVEE